MASPRPTGSLGVSKCAHQANPATPTPDHQKVYDSPTYLAQLPVDTPQGRNTATIGHGKQHPGDAEGAQLRLSLVSWFVGPAVKTAVRSSLETGWLYPSQAV